MTAHVRLQQRGSPLAHIRPAADKAPPPRLDPARGPVSPQPETARQAPPVALEDDGDPRQRPVAKLLEKEHRRRLAHKHLCPPKSVFRLRNADLVHDGDNRLPQRIRGTGHRPERRPRNRAQHAVSRNKAIVGLAEAITGTTHAHILKNAEIADLRPHQRLVSNGGDTACIRADTPHIVRGACGERVDQPAQLRAELRRNRLWAPLVAHAAALPRNRGRKVHRGLPAQNLRGAGRRLRRRPAQRRLPASARRRRRVLSGDGIQGRSRVARHLRTAKRLRVFKQRCENSAVGDRRRRREGFNDVAVEGISVLLEKVVGLVSDRARVVLENESSCAVLARQDLLLVVGVSKAV
eukprot:Opistho-2@64102